MVHLTLASVSKKFTEDLIDNNFKLKTKSEDSVKDIVVARAAPAGEGLISAVYRIQVTGSVHNASFVAKGLVEDRLLRRTLRCSNFLAREVYFYSKILPVLKDIQKSAGAKENIQDYIPIIYSYHIGDGEDFLLLEDLAVNGYKSLTDKITNHQRDITLKTLAHIHATSIALRIKKPKEFFDIANKLSEVYYNDDNRAWYALYLKTAANIDKTAVREVEGENSIYYKKFDKLTEEDIYGLLMKLVNTKGEHPVFNHGDAWFPNFLCSNDKALAIDFQLVRCASVATDLSYFLALCGNLCHTKEKFMEAVRVYYNYLEYFLMDMTLEPSKIFSWSDLQEELKKYGKFGMLAALTTIPLMGSTRCDVLMSFKDKYPSVDRIPLNLLWPLCPLDGKLKTHLVNAFRVAVDTGLI